MKFLRVSAASFFHVAAALLWSTACFAQDSIETQLLRRIAPFHEATKQFGDTVILNSISISGLSIAASKVELGAMQTGILPDDAAIDTYLARNCSTRERKYTATLTLEVEVGQEIVVTNLTSSTDNSKFTLEIPFSAQGKATGEGGRTVNVSLSKQSTNTFKVKETKTENIQRDVPAWTALYVVGKRKKLHHTLPFTADVVADGVVETLPLRAGDVYTVNVPPRRLSLFYPAEARSLRAVGSIINISATDTEITYVEQKLERNNPKHCPKIPGI